MNLLLTTAPPRVAILPRLCNGFLDLETIPTAAAWTIFASTFLLLLSRERQLASAIIDPSSSSLTVAAVNRFHCTITFNPRTHRPTVLHSRGRFTPIFVSFVRTSAFIGNSRSCGGGSDLRRGLYPCSASFL